MTGVVSLAVPLIVNIKVGERWGSMQAVAVPPQLSEQGQGPQLVQQQVHVQQQAQQQPLPEHGQAPQQVQQQQQKPGPRRM